jgi:hypothetical protein
VRLVKKTPKAKLVYVEDGGQLKLLRDMTVDDVEPLIITVGPFGPMAKFMGFSEHTYVMYFLIDSDDHDEIVRNVTGSGDEEGIIPLFQNFRAGYMGQGTLPAFWSNKRSRPLTKLMAGALQFVAEKDTLYITHMSVRSKWRRNRLNWLMVKAASDHEPGKPVVFDDPTDMGKKFMKKYEGLSGWGTLDDWGT